MKLPYGGNTIVNAVSIYAVLASMLYLCLLYLRSTFKYVQNSSSFILGFNFTKCLCKITSAMFFLELKMEELHKNSLLSVVFILGWLKDVTGEGTN